MNDLALLKADRPMKFNKYISPICLPDVGFKDQEIKVYVTGWGALSGKKCVTNSDGPSPNQKCSLPFVWMNETMNHCSFQSTPSYEQPICRNFSEANPGHWTAENLDTKVKIVDDKGKTVTLCYNELPGNHGWYEMTTSSFAIKTSCLTLTTN